MLSAQYVKLNETRLSGQRSNSFKYFEKKNEEEEETKRNHFINSEVDKRKNKKIKNEEMSR